ncbi:MAG: hypothetical protein H0T43_02300, partial [Solirubrobacterales bacterium]|nr:hypothetical protein [Solirubrobacterales bacterium]
VAISELLRAGLLVTEPGQRTAAQPPPGDAGMLMRRIAELEERVRALEARGR